MTNSGVYLRAVVSTDRAEFVALMQRSLSFHHPWISPPTTNRHFDVYYARISQDDHAGMLVCAANDNRIVGVININNIVLGSFRSASLGYYSGIPDAGRGFMRAGLELVKIYAVKKLSLHRLEANIQPQNTRSLAMVKACNFRYEGLSPAFLYINGAWRDHERWVFCDSRSGLMVDSG